MTTIFELLERDHRELERLLDQLVQTEGASAKRDELFGEFGRLLEAHSHAEERAFYSVVLAHSATRENTAHGTKEHCDAADALEQLRSADRSHGSWLRKLESLRDDVLHHIREEENELFPMARKVIDESEAEKIGRRFEQLRHEELAAA